MGGKEFINLTPHAINYYLEDGESQQTIDASGEVARVSTKSIENDPIGPFGVHKVESDEIIGLPDPKENTYYIVSTAVAEAVKGERDDILVPDTWDYGVRDNNGRIIGTKKFKKF